jgi:iron complex outermembrane receptor protein
MTLRFSAASIFFLVLASVAGQSTPALAEPADASSNAAPTAGLEEIVVTAQRREENLQHAAISVTAVSGADLSDAGAIKIQDLTQLVPSLQVTTAAGPYPLFYLRGVGNFNGNGFSDSAVAYNLDGVYVARPSSTQGNFFDLNRVEILKGPQGTLYGRNATGGAINVITNKPTGDFGGEATIDFGNYDTKNINAVLNVPFSPTLAARLAVQSTYHEGYLSDGTDDENGKAARLQVRFTPNDQFTVNTSADYYHQGGKGPGSTLLQAGVSGFVDGNPRIGNTSPPINAIYSNTLYFLAGNTFGPLLDKTLVINPVPTNIQQGNDYWGLSATAEWKTGAGTLTVIPAYRHSSLDFVSGSPGFLIAQRETDKQGSVEARFASTTTDPLTYLAGVYFLDEKIGTRAIYDQQYNESTQAYDLTTKSYAAFGRLSYAATDRLRLVGGVRFTDDQKSMNGTLNSSAVLCPGAFIPPPAGPQFCFGGVGQITVPNPPLVQSPSDSWKETTWRASVEYDAAPASLLYAAVETGFKAGGFFFTNDNPTYQPEKLTAYSIGSKNRFLDNKLQLNAEAFYWLYKDQQISHVGQDSAGEVVFPTNNVGKAPLKGVELEGQYLITATTLFMADLELLDAKYDDYVYSVPNFGVPPTTGCPYTPLAGGKYQINCSGKTPPQAPKRSFNFGLQQTIPIGDVSVVADVRTHYQSETLTGLEFAAIEMQDSYWMTDASLGVHGLHDRWIAAGYINNISDTTVIQGTFPHALAGFALTSATLRPPRTYGVRLTVKF